MVIPKGFITDIASKYIRGEISRIRALSEIKHVLELHNEGGADEILDSTVADIKFFYEDTE